jgi:hypothetical protein
MSRLRLLLSVCVVSALALGASLAEAAPPASLPDGPDLSLMALRSGDLSQATVIREGYETEQGSVAAYSRTFSFPRGARLLAAVETISLLGTSAQAQGEVAAIRRMLANRRQRATFARSFATSFMRGSGMRARNVTSSRPASLGIGVDSLRVAIKFRTPVGRIHAVFAIVRVDRAVAVVLLASQPGRTIPAGEVVRLGRVQRDLFRTGFTVAVGLAPVLTGAANQGQTLSADRGRWSGGPGEYAYQWSRCDAAGAACVPIAGAVSPTYAIGPQDVGSTLKVTVTARNSVSSASADSVLTAVVT